MYQLLVNVIRFSDDGAIDESKNEDLFLLKYIFLIDLPSKHDDHCHLLVGRNISVI